MATRLYKDGNVGAIVTECGDTEKFLYEVSELFSELIDTGRYQHDWSFQFQMWLPQVVEICCKLRGYKAEVREVRTIVCGQFTEDDKDLVAGINDRGAVNGRGEREET